jgi:hypothetical protein
LTVYSSILRHVLGKSYVNCQINIKEQHVEIKLKKTLFVCDSFIIDLSTVAVITLGLGQTDYIIRVIILSKSSS